MLGAERYGDIDMKTIETNATITNDGKLVAQVPPDISPGQYQVVVVIDKRLPKRKKKQLLDIPVIHVDSWPDNLSLRREDVYD
jgi:hypothetical protein